MNNVVICDDDRVTRGAITALCEDLGLHVVAETDQWGSALELIRRFDIDLVVLDLSLMDGSGEHVLEGLNGMTDAPSVVIFSAYAHDFRRLKQLGATDVVEKPDFERLASALELVAAARGADEAGEELISRRISSRDASPLPELWRSPSGIASRKDLDDSLLHVIERDSVLVVALTGVEAMEAAIGPTLVADCLLAVGRALARTVRSQDVVHDAPQANGFVALLRGGNDQAAGAAWDRTVGLVEAAAVPGQLVGSLTVVGALGARDAVARTIGELLSGGGMKGPAVGR